MSRGATLTRSLRVCVCTSNEALYEPRAPRHAQVLAQLGQGVEVVFVDCAPFGVPRRSVKALADCRNLRWRTHYFSSSSSTVARLVWDRARRKLAQGIFRLGGSATPDALSSRVFGLERVLRGVNADVYLGHNIDTLPAVSRVARARGALAMFDSMEFHSDMGDGQTQIEEGLVHAIEKEYLPRCALVLASSDQVADALVHEYGIQRPLALYNVPPLVSEIPPKPKPGLALYWRNAVMGLGQRGLDQALVALTKLPQDVILHLQGRWPADGGAALKLRIAHLGLISRVVFHEPYSPEDAVKEAALHHVGLCLECGGVRNHELTVSNKIFDYHMAGLAVIASDLPGLRSVIERSGGGLLFQPGSADDLATKIARLRDDQALRQALAHRARVFALREGNREVEMRKFAGAFIGVCRRRFELTTL